MSTFARTNFQKQFYMKRILALVVAIIVMACSKSKEDHSALYGEWAFQSQVENGKERKSLCDEYSYIIITESTYESHRFKESSGECREDIVKVNYSVSSNQISIENEGQKISVSYVIKGDILTMTSSSGVVISYKKNARKTPPAVPTNPFIGTWKLETFIVNGKVEHLDECQKQSTYVFTDTNLKVTSLNRKNNSTECETTIEEISYSISENKIVMRKGEKNIEYTFLIKDNTLTFSGITEGDIAEPFTITLKKQ